MIRDGTAPCTTSWGLLAEGRGYKLLNEPGEIDEVQYPPLLPAVVAVHQLLLGTSDPTRVGRLLRLSSFFVFIAYACVVFRFLRSYLPGGLALLASLLSLLCLHAWFLSDALFPEVGFSLATLLFLIFAGGKGAGDMRRLAYVCAIASYALRTVGIAAFAVWVLHSLIRRRFEEAADRALLVLLPIAGLAALCGVGRTKAMRTTTPRTNTSARRTCSTTSATPATLCSGTLSRRRKARCVSPGASSATCSTCRCISAKR